MTKAAIIGLGTMGPGIAAKLSRAGLSVRTFDASADQRATAVQRFQIAGGVLANLGMPNKGKGADIAVCTTLAECVAGADLVLENVSEKLEIKAEVFRAAEAI